MSERLEMSQEQMTLESQLLDVQTLHNRILFLTAERDALASQLVSVRDEFLREKTIITNVLNVILNHMGASIYYE